MEITILMVGIKVVLLNLMVTVVWISLAALPVVIGLILLLPMERKRKGDNQRGNGGDNQVDSLGTT